jgi:hypothetical protein
LFSERCHRPFYCHCFFTAGYLSLLDFPGHLGAKWLDLPQIWHVFPKVGQVWPARCCERPQDSSGTYWACNGATGCSWQNATQLQREWAR